MEIINSEITFEEIGGNTACIIGCGTFCFMGGGATTYIAVAAALL